MNSPARAARSDCVTEKSESRPAPQSQKPHQTLTERPPFSVGNVDGEDLLPWNFLSSRMVRSYRKCSHLDRPYSAAINSLAKYPRFRNWLFLVYGYVHDFKSDQEAIEFIDAIDQDDELGNSADRVMVQLR
jgi:hypothetical protein